MTAGFLELFGQRFELFFLAFFPVVSMGQTNSFDTNGNGYIDDEELVVIINYWAQHKPIPLTRNMTVLLPDDVPLNLVKIPAGEGIVNGKTVHVDEFWMGKFEITQAQWKAVMGTNPSSFKDPSKPVEMVSWNDCHAFLDKLNALGLGHFSLPGDAQWEYACRAGTDTEYFWGDSADQAGIYSWYQDNSGDETHAVGTRAPNPWGLYDMTGNVWEWCEDAWGVGYPYPYRVLRSGSWEFDTYNLGSGNRGWVTPAKRFNDLGFRVVRTP